MKLTLDIFHMWKGETKMIDFTEKPTCPKCGNDNRTYSGGFTFTYFSHPEYLLVTCNRCEYRFDMKTKDSPIHTRGLGELATRVERMAMEAERNRRATRSVEAERGAK
jgi:C4-type Zn-finger protein